MSDRKNPTIKDQIRTGLMVAWLVITFGLTAFQINNAYGWRIPHWVSWVLLVVGVVLLAWALLFLRNERKSQ